eukprot:scaffold9132_cov112-Isochrysis_galbana.AAC.3
MRLRERNSAATPIGYIVVGCRRADVAGWSLQLACSMQHAAVPLAAFPPCLPPGRAARSGAPHPGRGRGRAVGGGPHLWHTGYMRHEALHCALRTLHWRWHRGAHLHMLVSWRVGWRAPVNGIIAVPPLRTLRAAGEPERRGRGRGPLCGASGLQVAPQLAEAPAPSGRKNKKSTRDSSTCGIIRTQIAQSS